MKFQSVRYYTSVWRVIQSVSRYHCIRIERTLKVNVIAFLNRINSTEKIHYDSKSEHKGIARQATKNIRQWWKTNLDMNRMTIVILKLKTKSNFKHKIVMTWWITYNYICLKWTFIKKRNLWYIHKVCRFNSFNVYFG